MDISIIIINYNTFELTSQCIRSIYQYTEGIEYEIILVDNASVERNPDDFLKEFPNITLIKSDSNLGFAGGNNLGLKNSNGEYILLLNSDTILLNNAILLTYNKMKSQMINLATCKVYNEDKSIQQVCSFFPSVRISFLGLIGFIQFCRLLKIDRFSFQYNLNKQQKVEMIWGCFFMFKREIIDLFENSKLPDIFFMYSEDLQWCYILNQKGVDAWFLPEGEIIHYFSGPNLSLNPINNKAIQNYYIFLDQYYHSIRKYLIIIFDLLIQITRFQFKYIIPKFNFLFKRYIIAHV